MPLLPARTIALASCIVGLLLALAPARSLADEAEAHYRQALALKRQGNLEAALRAGQAAINARPDHAAAHFTVGTLQRQLGNLAGALACFRQVTRLQPSYAPGYAMVGATMFRLRRYAEALPPLRRATELDPSDAASWGNLGATYRRLDQLDEALDAYQQGLRRVPDDPGLLNNLAVAFNQMRRHDEAIALLEEALEKPDAAGNASFHLNLAIAYRRAERWQDALPHYDMVLSQDPNHRDALFDKAVCHEQLSQPEQAIAAYRRYAEIVREEDGRGAAYAEERVRYLGGR